MAAPGIRKQQAQQTRERICDAAKQLFLDGGYSATTVTEIARAAGVAHQTVYFTFGSKARLLSEIIDSEIVGDSLAIPLLERPQITRIAQIPDRRRRLQRVVAVSCDITQRLAPLYEIVRSGAADDAVRDLLDRHEEQRWLSHRALATLLEGEPSAHVDTDLDEGLGVDLDAAADCLYALLSHEMYWLLVQRRGWSVARWRQFVFDQAACQLLPQRAG
jgi:AcrR family transcriptional regulator